MILTMRSDKTVRQLLKGGRRSRIKGIYRCHRIGYGLGTGSFEPASGYIDARGQVDGGFTTNFRTPASRT